MTLKKFLSSTKSLLGIKRVNKKCPYQVPQSQDYLIKMSFFSFFFKRNLFYELTIIKITADYISVNQLNTSSLLALIVCIHITPDCKHTLPYTCSHTRSHIVSSHLSVSHRQKNTKMSCRIKADSPFDIPPSLFTHILAFRKTHTHTVSKPVRQVTFVLSVPTGLYLHSVSVYSKGRTWPRNWMVWLCEHTNIWTYKKPKGRVCCCASCEIQRLHLLVVSVCFCVCVSVWKCVKREGAGSFGAIRHRYWVLRGARS